jgi:hypothetical protein
LRRWALSIQPFTLVWAVWHRLPATAAAVWLFGWGAALIGGAWLIVSWRYGARLW